jgi:hypothetical protein
MLNRITLAILCALFASASVAYIVEGTRISRPQMLSYAKNKLQNQGTVEQTANGITYLKIPDSYTKELLQQIQMPGYGPPKQSQIPIIGEHEAKNIIKFSELGKTVRFKPLGFYTIMEDNLEYFVLAVDAPPTSLKIILPDLKSRLSWGVVYQLNSLDDDQKLAALQLRAQIRGLDLEAAVGKFLLRRFTRNMAQLFMVLEQLDQASLAEQRRLTIPFVKEVLGV